MEVNLNIPFHQLLRVVESLTPTQKAILKQALESEIPTDDDKEALYQAIGILGEYYAAEGSQSAKKL